MSRSPEKDHPGWKKLCKNKRELDQMEHKPAAKKLRKGWTVVDGTVHVSLPDFLAEERRTLIASRDANKELYQETLAELHTAKNELYFAKKNPLRFLFKVWFGRKPKSIKAPLPTKTEPVNPLGPQ